jgi:hypothetical protein
MDSIRDNGTGVSVHGYKVNNLTFADGTDLLEDRKKLQGNMERINEAGEAAGLQINMKKTMTMVFGQGDIQEELAECERISTGTKSLACLKRKVSHPAHVGRLV